MKPKDQPEKVPLPDLWHDLIVPLLVWAAVLGMVIGLTWWVRR
jgi:hypothetical protein